MSKGPAATGTGASWTPCAKMLTPGKFSTTAWKVSFMPRFYSIHPWSAVLPACLFVQECAASEAVKALCAPQQPCPAAVTLLATHPETHTSPWASEWPLTSFPHSCSSLQSPAQACLTAPRVLTGPHPAQTGCLQQVGGRHA